MDPDDDAQMRQMMGFSSFGNKPKHAKVQDNTPKSRGTSTNLTPLGHRMTTDNKSKNKTTLASRTVQPEDMGFYEQDLDEESSRWVAARLANPSPPNDSSGVKKDITATENLTTSTRQQPADLTAEDPSTKTSPHLNVQAQPFEPEATPNDDVASETVIKPRSNPNTTSVYSTNDIRSEPTYWTSGNDKHNWENDIGYKSPWTGAEFTRKELKEYAVGKQVVKENGEVVLTFFKPSFVEEDPWAAWAGLNDGEEQGRF